MRREAAADCCGWVCRMHANERKRMSHLLKPEGVLSWCLLCGFRSPVNATVTQ